MTIEKGQLVRMAQRGITSSSNLSSFEDWFVPASWNIKSDNPAYELVFEIELHLAEYSNGDFDFTELKRRIQDILTREQPS